MNRRARSECSCEGDGAPRGRIGAETGGGGVEREWLRILIVEIPSLMYIYRSAFFFECDMKKNDISTCPQRCAIFSV